MRQLDRPLRLLAVALAALAGFIDAIGFLSAGGFFVSFMSGNSTRLAVGIGERPHDALVAAGLILGFVLGVALGAVVNERGGERGRALVLAFVCVLLAGAALLAPLARPAALACMVLAMGAENAAFSSNGAIRFGITYMTGTLSRLGHALAAALMGRGDASWLPDLMLWLGLVAGATLGAAAYLHLGMTALWIGVALAALLALAQWRRGPDGQA